ncbi:MAG: peptidylprolyl isomerase [Rhodothermia bacterium]|nr:peptidylprolyl isomerase [Rhodothermia bacterium]
MHKPVIIAVSLAVAITIAWLTGLVPGGPSDSVVATIDGDAVSVDEFRREYAEYLLESGLPDNDKRRSDFLQRLVSVELLIRDQEDNGAAESEAYGFASERVRRKLLIEGYLAKHVYDDLRIDDTDLQNMYVRINTTLKASHLYAPTLQRAEILSERLRQGEAFEDLARETFESPELRESGGSVGYFGFDEMDPAFEDAAYNLEPGEVSKPVRTETGYSIIRLDDRLIKPILTESEFAARKKNLYRYVTVRKRRQAKDAFYNNLQDEIDLSIDLGVFERLYRGLSGGLVDNSESPEGMEMSEVIADFDGRSLTVAEFFDEALFTSLEQREAVRSPDALEAFVEGIAMRLAIVDRAIEAGIDELPEFDESLRDEMDGWLYDAAWKSLESELTIDEDTLRAFFAAHGDEFEQRESVHVTEILLNSMDEAVKLRPTLTGSNFGRMAALHSVRPGADESNGELGYVGRDQLGVLAATIFDASTGEILGPIEVAGKYALILVGEKSAARAATFAESRQRIYDILKLSELRERVRQRTEELRAVYEVNTFDEVLADVQLGEQAT